MVSSSLSGQAASSPVESFWVPAPDSRRARIVCRALLAAAFSLFVFYFAICCFVKAWGSDFQVYCAAVARLYVDLLHPAHEAVTAPATESFAFSPYLVLVGAMGKLLRVTPYRALQIAGIVNMTLFGAGAAYFVSRHSIHRRWELSFICFLFVTLFLRWVEYGWSSETSLVALQYNQCYPSTIAWALAFFAFGLLEPAVSGRRSALALLTAIVSMLLLTHGLTASWTVGIVGLYALVTSLQSKDPWPLLRVLGAFALALGAALLWPYTPLLGQGGLLSTREGSPFGGHPIAESLNLYCIGFVCAAYLLVRVRKHEFWVLGCMATLAALRLWRVLGIEYGNRYAYFATFFMQFIIAEVMTMGLLSMSRPLAELPSARPLAGVDRPLTVAVLLAALVAWIPSPMLKKTKDDLLHWPTLARNATSPHDSYYQRVPALQRHLSPDDVVLMQSIHLVFDVASLTGARFVSSPYMVRVPDARERENDVYAFFDPATSPEQRAEIVQRRGVTKAVLLRRQFGLFESFKEQFGPPEYKDGILIVFKVDGDSVG
jgi:hypothetical protein